MPIAQLLVYPVTDARMNTPSYTEQANAKPLNAAMMAWFWNYYLENESKGREAYASPLLAQSLTGLPPTVIYTSEMDPLRGDGEAYARALSAAGVPVTGLRMIGQTHSSIGILHLIPSSDHLHRDIVATLGSLHDDPIVYAAGDWVSWAVFACLAASVLLAWLPRSVEL